MMKGNVLIFGFKGVKDLSISAFGLNNTWAGIIFSVMATLNSFITKYIYDDAKAVYFLVFLIAFDALTGVWKAIKNRQFSSSRLPRILVLMILYVTLLGIGWNAAKFSSFYFWLPSVLYGGMVGTLIVSIAENLMELGYISKSLYELIKKKVKDALKINGNGKKQNGKKGNATFNPN
jgi:hypothetical protein